MKISQTIDLLFTILDSVVRSITSIPGLMMLCTVGRRPGFSSILASAKIFSDMNLQENDDIVKKFVYNVVDKMKLNIHDDGVCLITIPPGELKYTLYGGNEGGPIVFTEDPKDSSKLPSNPNYVFLWGIIK